MAKDYYASLGVSKSASADEIKRAFRKLAHEHHPDKSTGNAEKFKEINEAYQILGDKNKRAKYDQFGSAAFSAGGGDGFDFSGFRNGGFNMNFGDMGDLGEMFGEMFGGGRSRATRRQKGDDIEMDISLDFKEMVHGAKKEISVRRRAVCEKCEGSGAEDKKTKECGECNGKGSKTENLRTVFGTIRQEVLCDMCSGRGIIPVKECSNCRGEGVEHKTNTFTVQILSGMENGSAIRLKGKGNEAPRGGVAGDLYLRIYILQDKRFDRDGRDIRSRINIGFTQAALGGEVEVETVDGRVTVSVSEGIQSGTELRLRGRGIATDYGRGDHLLTIIVKTPTKLSRAQKKGLEDLGLE